MENYGSLPEMVEAVGILIIMLRIKIHFWEKCCGLM
jgi:hypothetical protein